MNSDIITQPERIKAGRPKDSVKREEILAAATHLFLQHGFELTSMEAVARQANVSKLTIYSHFKDKNELFYGIMQARCTRVGMPDSYAAMVNLSAEEALRQIATHAATVIFSTESVQLQRVLYGEAVRHPEIVKIYYDTGPSRLKTAFADLLRIFDSQGKLRIPDPVRATEQFFSLIKGERLTRALLHLAPLPSGDELAAHIEANVSLFLNAYRPSNTPSAKTERL